MSRCRLPDSIALAVFVLALAPLASADAVRVTAGYGEGINLYALVLQLDRASPLHEYAAWDLTAHVDLGVGEFQGHRASSASQNTTRALAAIGKLRWQRRAAQPLAPFVEVGFGLAGFSETTIGGVRHLGGDFEFTEVLRIGVRFGSHLQYEVGAAGQHFSNAGLFPPNDGVTYVSLSGAWYFR
jgi:Lipid A 3-O-deacylase (PagL)